jgi:hypothetical protein
MLVGNDGDIAPGERKQSRMKCHKSRTWSAMRPDHEPYGDGPSTRLA